MLKFAFRSETQDYSAANGKRNGPYCAESLWSTILLTSDGNFIWEQAAEPRIWEKTEISINADINHHAIG